MSEQRKNELTRSTLLLLLAVIMLVYVAGISVFGAQRTIEAGNVIMASLWIGVCVAYFPIVWDVAKFRKVDGATILSASTLLIGLAVFYWTFGAIVWRIFGRPPEWVDSALRGLYMPLLSSAAILKMITPQVINGRVPTEGWIRLGSYVSAGLLLFAVIVLQVFD